MSDDRYFEPYDDEPIDLTPLLDVKPLPESFHQKFNSELMALLNKHHNNKQRPVHPD